MLIAAKILLITLFIALALFLLVLTFLTSSIKEALREIELRLADFRDSILMKPHANTLSLLLPLISALGLKFIDRFMMVNGKSLFLKAIDVLIVLFKAADTFFKAFSRYLQVKNSLKR